MARDFVAFLSYAREDGEAFAADLRTRLERDYPDITLWQDRTRLAGGTDFRDQINRAIDEVQFLIVVMTPAALRSDWVRKEWRYAREQGVCVCPVKAAANADLDQVRRTLPHWMSDAHTYDPALEWERLVQFLRSPCQAVRVPHMADRLPDVFVERPAEFAQILDRVLDGNRQNPSGARVVLHGSGGFGKTTLALSIANDGDVVAACDGGILWATLGEQPAILPQLKTLYAAISGDRPEFATADDAAIELAKMLDGKRCLILIDDVWDMAHVRPFLRGGDESTRLITTRSFKIAGEIASGPDLVNVGELKPSEAVDLLTARLEPRPSDLAPYRHLAARLAEWPLLLELANAALREQINYRQTLDDALAWINTSLDRRGVVAFDPEDASERRQAIAKTVELSLGLLGNKRERCVELAVFPEDVDIPLPVVQLIWGTDEIGTRELALRMGQLTLIKLNLPGRSIRLHDSMRSYYKTQLSRSAVLHARLADAWQSPARLATDYARRFAVYHIVEAMEDPAEAHVRGRQLLTLLGDTRFQTWQQQRGDVILMSKQLQLALGRAALSSQQETPFLLAELAIVFESYETARQPGVLFELARNGMVLNAAARVELFDPEPEWDTAARLALAWTGAAANPSESQSIEDACAAACDRPELQSLLEWVRQPSGSVPSGVQEIKGTADLHLVSRILARAGGAEGSGEGIEPIDVGLVARGLSAGLESYIAEGDGPILVAFASLDPLVNTQYLKRYIAIHAANKYRYYRNRSLSALLRAVLKFPSGEWVRAMVEDLVTAALAVTPVHFRDSLPLAVRAVEARRGDAIATAKLDGYRDRLVAEAASLSPERGKSDSWSYFQRRASALAEAYAAGLGRPDEAARLLALARELPKGFAGFRAFSALTLAEAVSIAAPADTAMVEAALLSALAASHRIQDYPFCYQTTAMVNAMRRRWWTGDDIDLEMDVAEFLATPLAPKFCSIHCVGDPLEYRGQDKGQVVPIPDSVRRAGTLKALAHLYRRDPTELLRANADAGWTLEQTIDPGTEVNIPDPDFAPILAARFAAQALRSDTLPTFRKVSLIQALVPAAEPNPTALNTVLARLLLCPDQAPVAVPRSLAELEAAGVAPDMTPSEGIVA